MIARSRAATLALAALLTVALAVPASAMPGGPKDGAPGRKDAKAGNPVAHCLDDRDTGKPAPKLLAAVVETATPPAKPKKDNKGISDCVHAALKDIKGPHAEAIVAVVVEGIAAGYPDGSFKPNRPVTRGQMATFLTRALDLATGTASGFPDVDGNPHAEAVAAIVRAGIAEGYADGTFKPNKPVSRAQMAAFLSRALDLAAEHATDLPDVVGNPHEAAIAAIVEAGIAHGFTDGTFKPNKPVSRGQMAAFLNRALGL